MDESPAAATIAFLLCLPVSYSHVLAARHWQTEQHGYSCTEEHDDLYYAISMMAVNLWQNPPNNSKKTSLNFGGMKPLASL